MNKSVVAIILILTVATGMGMCLAVPCDLNAKSNMSDAVLPMHVIISNYGDYLDQEVASSTIYDQFVQIYNDQLPDGLWLVGFTEAYDNQWGMRFKPDSLAIAEVTVEEMQTTLQQWHDYPNLWLNRTAAIAMTDVVSIVPEFPNSVILFIILFAILPVIVYVKKKLSDIEKTISEMRETLD